MANLSNINNKFIVTDGGNVLIGGNISGSSILQVTGASTFAGNVILSSALPLLYLTNTTASTGKNWRLSSATNGKFFIAQEGVVDALTIDHTSGNATFAGNTEAQKVTSTKGFFATGNIVAPASGTSALIIDYYLGNSRFWSRGANATTKGGFQFIQLENDGGSQTTSLAIDSSSNATFAGNVNISSPGDLYINSGTSYNNKGSIFMSNQRTEIVSDIVDGTANGDTSLNFKTRSGGGTSSALFINEFRRIGIGTSSPDEKLEVKGNIVINSQSTSSATTELDQLIFRKLHPAGAGSGYYNQASIRSKTFGGYSGGLNFYTNKSLGSGSYGERLAMSINNFQNVGINATPVQNSNRTTLAIQDVWGGQIDIMVGTTVHAQFGTDNFSSGKSCRLFSKDDIVFKTGGSGAIKMQLTDAGRVLINNTNTTSDSMCHIGGNASNYALYLYADVIYASGYRYQRFRSGGNIAGGIEGSNQTSVVYNTSSDYRMKKNIKPLKDGLDRVCKLKPVKFDWKLNDETTEGFIAHEVQDIFPDAITGIKDGKDMQGMDYGRITPLLVKAIQELKAEIELLKNK